MDSNFSKNKILSIWDEFHPKWIDWSKLRFMPWGSATIEVPRFFRANFLVAAEQMTTDDFQYTLSYGTEGLRRAISEHFGPLVHFASPDPQNNIAVFIGAIELITRIIDFFVLDETDEIILFEPYYPWHMLPFQRRGTPVFSAMRFDEATGRFQLDLSDLKSKLGPRTRALVLCNPNNPCGHIFTETEYLQLSALLAEYPSVKVIEDAAYSIYVRPGQSVRYFHELPGNFDKTITIFSGGKLFNTTGVRIGWAFGSKILIPLIKVAYYNTNWPSCIEQKIIELSLKSALEPYQGYPSFWEFIRHDVADRVEYLTSRLGELGLSCLPWEGSYYILVDVKRLAEIIEPEYFRRLDSPETVEPYIDKAVARKLVKQFGVGLLPLSALYCSQQKDDRFLRIALNREYEHIDLVISAFRQLIQRNSPTII